MNTINRTAMVVRPDQSFLDWVYRADATSNELSLEELRREPKVYLLPECEMRKRLASISATIRFSRRCEPHAFILWRGPAVV
jgi:hypothetical protein